MFFAPRICPFLGGDFFFRVALFFARKEMACRALIVAEMKILQGQFGTERKAPLRTETSLENPSFKNLLPLPVQRLGLPSSLATAVVSQTVYQSFSLFYFHRISPAHQP